MSKTIQLSFSDEMNASLEYYQQKMNLNSFETMIQDALNLYLWTLEQQEDGFKVYSKKVYSTKEIVRELNNFIKQL